MRNAGSDVQDSLVYETWSFVYAKQKNVPESCEGEFGCGSVRTFTAMDANTKPVPCWYVGLREIENAYKFISDLMARLANRVQITTDGHGMHLEAVEQEFRRDVNYSMLVEMYGQQSEEA